MKKVGDLLTALGVVGFIAVVLELIIGWRMIPQSIMLGFTIGSFILFLIGMIIRNSEENKSNGKDMKQIGVSMLIFGAVLLGIVFVGMFSDSSSAIAQFVNNRFFFLVVFGLVFLLTGIVMRSIGKSKENKNNN